MFGDKRWHLFTLLGQKVYVRPAFLLLLAVFLFPAATAADFASLLMWLPAVFVGILFHELGHAMANRRLGYGDSIIELAGLGGVTINQRRGRVDPKRSLVVNAAGPAFSLLLALVFAAAYLLAAGAFSIGGLFTVGLLGLFAMPADFASLGLEFLYKMAALNGFWFLFNILPVSPMDGGHMLENGLHIGLKDRPRALLYAAYVSLTVLVAVVVASLLLFRGMGILMIVLAALFAHHNWRTIQRHRGVTATPRRGGGGGGSRKRWVN